MKNYKFLGFALILVSCSMVASSTVSAKPIVKENSTHFLQVEGTVYDVPFVLTSMTALNDHQVIDIPVRAIAYPEIAGTLKANDPKKVTANANSPPRLAYR